MSEPQPCGRIASCTWCCEYHGIHSDDAFGEIASIVDVTAHQDLDLYQLGMAFGRIRAIVRKATAAPETEPQHHPDVRGLIAAQTAVGVQQEARIAELEGQVLARDAQVLEDGRTIVDQRIKLDGAKQILVRVRGHAAPIELARRIDHWMASAMPSDYERVCNHLIRHLVIAAVGWSSGDGTLEDLQQVAHQLRAAGEL